MALISWFHNLPPEPDIPENQPQLPNPAVAEKKSQGLSDARLSSLSRNQSSLRISKKRENLIKRIERRTLSLTPLIKEDPQNSFLESKYHGKCNAIFTINPGRSGSGYLAAIFQMLDPRHFAAFHESWPVMNDKDLVQSKENGLNATATARKEKKMKGILPHLNRGKTYIEANHLFITNFFDVVIEELTNYHCKIDVVILRRNLSDVLKSLIRTKFKTQATDWYHEPTDKIATLPAPPLKRAEHFALWYLYDIEAKVHEFRRRYPSINLVEVRLEELKNRTQIEAFLNLLHLPLPSVEVIDSVSSSVINSKGSLKAEVKLEIPTRILIDQFQELCTNYSIKLTPMPSLETIIPVEKKKLPRNVFFQENSYDINRLFMSISAVDFLNLLPSFDDQQEQAVRDTSSRFNLFKFAKLIGLRLELFRLNAL